MGVGFMFHWGMKIDGVTVVMLIVALGLAVDYSAHIGVAYLHTHGRTRGEAVIEALADMGTPVCHGAMSTFIAIVVLAGSKSFVFISFFKQLFFATVLGCGHGMLLLPVLLSLCAPEPSKDMAYQMDNSSSQPAVTAAPVVGVQEVQMKEDPQCDGND